MNWQTAAGLLIPFAGTSLGAAGVFLMRGMLKDGVQRGLTGFAAGVMTAASVWSLLIPALSHAENWGKWSFIPAAGGFWLGVLFLLLLDHLIPHLHRYSDQAEGPKSRFQRTTMLILAVTLHNIPEGMAVGVVYAGLVSGEAGITAANGIGLVAGDRDSEFSRRRHYFHAFKGRRLFQTPCISVRSFVRCGRTGSGIPDSACGADYSSGFAMAAQLCGRRYALCS